jgi:dipeptidase E
MKKLILLSRDFTKTAESALKEFTGKNNKEIKIAFSRNAADLDPEPKYVEDSKKQLKDFGYKITEFDINQYCGKCGELLGFLKKFDAVFFSGGNANYLIFLFYKNGILNDYANFINDGNIVHIGSSAGSMICSPTTKYSRLLEDKSEFELDDSFDKALGLVNIYLHPHYADKIKYTKLYEKILKNNIISDDILIPLTNSQCVIVRDNEWELF